MIKFDAGFFIAYYLTMSTESYNAGVLKAVTEFEKHARINLLRGATNTAKAAPSPFAQKARRLGYQALGAGTILGGTGVASHAHGRASEREAFNQRVRQGYYG